MKTTVNADGLIDIPQQLRDADHFGFARIGMFAVALLFATRGSLLLADSPHFPHTLCEIPAPAGLVSPLVQGRDGYFYGTTSLGAVPGGVVYRISRSGKLETLAAFDDFTGVSSRSGLIQASDGNFYGTAADGGVFYMPYSFGAIYKMTPAGELSMFFSFSGTNGYAPVGRLLEGKDGNFYGTTYGGYFDPTTFQTYGTVFRLTPQGELTTLVWFTPETGYAAYAGLVQGKDGNFYGTTAYGGTNDIGTVFKVTPEGQLTTLVSFNGLNGESPYVGLVEGSDGNFYGATYYGGAKNMGTIFQITPSGVLRTLVAFNGRNGSYPGAELIEGTDGNLYGTTEDGGQANLGTVFRLSKSGRLQTLFSFNSNSKNFPVSRSPSTLVQGKDGQFYGTTPERNLDPAIVYVFGNQHGRY